VVRRTPETLALALGVALGLGMSSSRARAEDPQSPPVPAAAAEPGLSQASPAATVPPESSNAPPVPAAAAPPPAAPPASLPAGPLLAPTVAATTEKAPPPVARPRFSVAAAVGISIDNQGIADGRNVAVPSFSVQGGIGQDVLGFDARLFASEAAGQFSTPSQVAADRNAPIADVGADRQAADLMMALRPFARWERQRLDWPARFVRALTVDVGAAVERVSIGAQTVQRIGAVLAAYADLPLTPADDTSALHLRLAARRMLGTHADVAGAKQIGDTRAELLAGLAVIF
jgi:hypothetical protein